MKYSQRKTLLQDEHIILDVQISWVPMIPAVFLLELLVLADIALLILLIMGSTKLSAGLMLMLLFELFLVYVILSMRSYSLTVTNKRIFGKSGIIRISEMDSPIDKVQNIKFEQGLRGRMFKYGHVAVTTASGVYKFMYIKNPEKFTNSLLSSQDVKDTDKMTEQARLIAEAMIKAQKQD